MVPHYVLNGGYSLVAAWRADVNMIEQRGGLYTYGGIGLKMRSQGRVEWTYTVGFSSREPMRNIHPLATKTRWSREQGTYKA
ncbi:MAG: hypothetical protein R3B47_12290 [Bacteroidia bacterium]